MRASANEGTKQMRGNHTEHHYLMVLLLDDALRANGKIK